ncbi:hypothetical protein FMEAI12_4020045 [Parafrankia sp. Ea1.12]|nr:hypothetical protein FMEAI12_4020045 [Parafrankia sp. Ea1.12]
MTIDWYCAHVDPRPEEVRPVSAPLTRVLSLVRTAGHRL